MVEAWTNGRSRNRAVNHVFRRIHQLLEEHSIELFLDYVQSKHNPADGPSRGRFPPFSLLLPDIPLPDDLRSTLRPVNSENADIKRAFSAALPKPSPASDRQEQCRNTASQCSIHEHTHISATLCQHDDH